MDSDKVATDNIVPLVDASSFKPDPPSGKYGAIELRLLDAEANAKEKINREADQRYWLRFASVGICVLAICGMSWLLWAVADKLLAATNLPSKGAYVIALYVAPIVSVTTLSISLLVSAFRGYKDSDERTGLSAASQGAQATGLSN
jgi:hypothetical protein